MGEYTWQEEIRLLEIQIAGCKEQIAEIQQRDDRYLTSMQNFLEYITGKDGIDDEYRLTAQNFIKVKKEIDILKNQMIEFKKSLKEIYDMLASLDNFSSDNKKPSEVLEEENNIKEVKEMVGEIYSLVVKNKNFAPFQPKQNNQEGSKGDITFRELQELMDSKAKKETQLKPGSDPFPRLDTSSPQINPSYETGRFVSKHIVGNLENKEKTGKKLRENIDNPDINQEPNISKDPGGDKSEGEKAKKNSWFHTFLG